MNRKETHVHVIGTGTIGEPLIGLLIEVKKDLGIDTISFHKRTPLLSDRSKVKDLIRRGALLAADEEAIPHFEDMGMKVTLNKLEAMDKADVVIDCTPSGVGQQNKTEFYENFKHNTLGFVAQGSEFGFGKPYARGINDSALVHGEDQFIQVVSCNTHNLAVLLDTLGSVNKSPDNLISAKFVMMRRANDISQDGSFLPAPQAGKHDDPKFGTHHARDAYYLFKTLGHDLNVFSSAIKLNTQYMHSVWFDIEVREPVTLAQVIARLRDNRRIAVTDKRSANTIFSFGRDHGHFGRILNQTVVCLPSLHVASDHDIVGFSFTPQDGNPLLSSVAIVAWYLYPEDYEKKISCLTPYFFDEI
jgi:glyceraldehyde-3-phosphate dehydrogenase (NAD(P))